MCVLPVAKVCQNEHGHKRLIGCNILFFRKENYCLHFSNNSNYNWVDILSIGHFTIDIISSSSHSFLHATFNTLKYMLKHEMFVNNEYKIYQGKYAICDLANLKKWKVYSNNKMLVVEWLLIVECKSYDVIHFLQSSLVNICSVGHCGLVNYVIPFLCPVYNAICIIWNIEQAGKAFHKIKHKFVS